MRKPMTGPDSAWCHKSLWKIALDNRNCLQLRQTSEKSNAMLIRMAKRSQGKLIRFCLGDIFFDHIFQSKQKDENSP